jgi:hypothetical protein
LITFERLLAGILDAIAGLFTRRPAPGPAPNPNATFADRVMAEFIARGVRVSTTGGPAKPIDGGRILTERFGFRPSDADVVAEARIVADRLALIAGDRGRPTAVCGVGSTDGPGAWLAWVDWKLESTAPGPGPTPPPSPGDYSADELELLERHNKARVLAGDLAFDPHLVQAARDHAKWMADNKNMSHTGAGGSSPSARARKAGYPSGFTGENIAYNYGGPGTAMTQWLTSPGHLANIMRGSYKDVGFGVAKRPDGRTYYCALFGAKTSNAPMSLSDDELYPPGLATEANGTQWVPELGVGVSAEDEG